MKTEKDYGYAYAEWFDENDPYEAGPVDIDEMVHGTVDIPEGDYLKMVQDGIENPDSRLYWQGFNSFFGA